MRTLTLAVLPGLAFLGAPAVASQLCTSPPTGETPLSDLADGTYQGFEGGLYPGADTGPPPRHDAAALVAGTQVAPLDAAGRTDASGGRVVLLALGQGHTTLEFGEFVNQVSVDPLVSPRVLAVDGALSGVDAVLMANPADPYWSFVDAQVIAAGGSALQVQAVWLKQAVANPAGSFPGSALALKGHLQAIVQNARSRWPNLRLLYLSSRSYAGYAAGASYPEPYAYEGGFAVKWLIEDQIDGAPALNHDPAQGPVLAPVLLWGPYLWADGTIPRSDGLTWECGDFQADGVHPSASGQKKVGALLQRFFQVETSAKVWYLANPTVVCGGQAVARKYGQGAGGPNGTVQLVASQLPRVPTLDPLVAFAFGGPPGAVGAFLLGSSSLGTGTVPFLGGSMLVGAPSVLFASTDSNGQASLSFGALPNLAGVCGTTVFVQYVVMDSDSPSGYDVSRGLQLTLGH